MRLNEIHIRDPFILRDQGKYYMYGSRGTECWGKCTGLDVYVSDDLEEWSEPTEAFTRPGDFWSDMHFWGPEVYAYEGSYYMFVSFKSEQRRRGVQVLRSDSPLGPFLPHSDGPVTPEDWECLDGTLYVEQGKPYMVFCHEWQQINDGEMCAIRLSEDLKERTSEPILLFRASQPVWTDKGKKDFVTDAPCLYKTLKGTLLMTWSSYVNEDYCVAVAYSENGSLLGEWKHKEELFFAQNGGSAMIFHTKEGQLKMILHCPNTPSLERPCILDIYEDEGMLFRKGD